MRGAWLISAALLAGLSTGAAEAQRFPGPNTRLGSPNTGLNAPNTRLIGPDTRPPLFNTRLVPPRTGLVAPNTRLIPPDTRLIPPDTRLNPPGGGVFVPNTSPFIPNTSPFAPDTRPFVPNTRPFVPNTRPFVPNTELRAPSTGLRSPVDGSEEDPTFLGFTPGVTPGNEFVPSEGGGYYYDPYWGYGGYTGPLVDATGAWLGRGLGSGWGGRSGVPLLGWTTPPLRPARGRVSPALEQARQTQRLEEVMASRPLTEATMVRLDADGVTVRYRQNGVTKQARFAPTEVFLLQNDRLWDAATSPNPPKPGDRVLVPLAERSGPRRARR